MWVQPSSACSRRHSSTPPSGPESARCWPMVARQTSMSSSRPPSWVRSLASRCCRYCRSYGRSGADRMPDVDLAVIGAGAAGLSITAVAAQLGLRVTLIERDRMGGDCLNFGCVPSKALLAASHAARAARGATRFGMRLPEPEIDWTAVQQHVHGVITAIAPNDSE